MENRTWERGTYKVNMVDFDFDLKQFEVEQDGEVIDVITPYDMESQQAIINDLDTGDCVDGWENGLGEVVHIPEPYEIHYFKGNLLIEYGVDIVVNIKALRQLEEFLKGTKYHAEEFIEGDIVDYLEDIENELSEGRVIEKELTFALENADGTNYEQTTLLLKADCHEGEIIGEVRAYS